MRLDLPMPVVAKIPTWLARARPGNADREVDDGLAAAQPPDGKVAHPAGQEGEVLGLGATTRENWVGRLLGLRNTVRCPPGASGGARYPRQRQLGHPVGAPGLLVERVGTGLAPFVVGQQRARHPLGPARLPVLGAVGDVDDPEQVAPVGGLVHADQQLAEEQVLVGCGPERGFEDVLAEQPSPDLGRVAFGGRHERSISRWRSANARSRTSRGTPARSKPSSSWDHTSSRSQPGQAASRSATLSG